MFIAISNQKGGVAKTTTAINLGASLAAAGKRLLLIDMDPQGNATMGSGVNKHELDANLYQVLCEDLPARDAIIRQTPAGYDLIPANADLTAASIELLKFDRRQEVLARALAGIYDDYDYILCDCPPALNILTLNAFVAADRLLVPIQCEYYALEGLSDLLHTTKSVRRINPRLEIEGFVRTLYDKRNNLATEVSALLIKRFGDKVFNTIIARNVRLAEAPSHGLPVMLYDRHSSGAQNHYALAGELMRRHVSENHAAEKYRAGNNNKQQTTINPISSTSTQS